MSEIVKLVIFTQAADWSVRVRMAGTLSCDWSEQWSSVLSRVVSDDRHG